MEGESITGNQGGTEDRLVIYPRRWKLALLALGALAFVFTGLWIGGLFGGPKAGLGMVVVATYVGVPVFGLCFVYALYRLVVRKPALVVSREGILDNASALGAGMIRWEEIREVRSCHFGTQRMLVIVPRDEGAILARQNPAKRLLMLVNKSLAGYAVNIPQNVLPMSDGDVIEEIKRYRKTRLRT